MAPKEPAKEPEAKAGEDAAAASNSAPGFEFNIMSHHFGGWAAAVTWVSAALGLYITLEGVLTRLVPFNQEAEQRLHVLVPPMAYWLSASAFFTAFILSAVSFVFEDTPAKRQHALMSCFVKGIAAHCDVCLASDRALVLLAPGSGALWLPQHYLQWLVTVPTLLVSISRTSDFTFSQIALVVAANSACIILGFIGNLLTLAPAMACFILSSVAMFYVLLQLYKMMVGSIGNDKGCNEARSSWTAIYWISFAIWNTFAVAWLISRLLPPPADLIAEIVVMVSNFLAKVVLSSSVVFGNYLTASQRRLLVAKRRENAERVALVAQLTKAITEKDQFMSLMSHELRTPLNGIIQLSDFLCSGNCGDVGDKAKHFSHTIKNSGNHLLNIINDILDAAALKEGRLTIKHEEVNLAEAVQNVYDITNALARKGVVLEQHVDPHTPNIIGDAGRVTQILFNLTGNALKFTHSGKVSITVRPGGQKHYVVINVTDTGCGIPKDKLSIIFEAFKQVDMSVSRKYGGTGLGLQIVQSLVEAHGGTISVSSVVDKGTKFTVRLPVLQVHVRRSLERKMQQSLELKGYDYEDMLPLVAPGAANNAPARPSQQQDSGLPENWVPRGDDSHSFSAYRASICTRDTTGGTGGGHRASMSTRDNSSGAKPLSPQGGDSGSRSSRLHGSVGSGKVLQGSGGSGKVVSYLSSASSAFDSDHKGGGAWDESTPEPTKSASNGASGGYDNRGSDARGPSTPAASGRRESNSIPRSGRPNSLEGRSPNGGVSSNRTSLASWVQ